MPEPAHSAEYLGDYRDDWWNSDFLALMARRLNFEAISTILDVGCGKGHWGRALLPHLPPSARLTGVDPEDAWVTASREAAAAKNIADRADYRQARAESLPFEDDSFDLVTCQTVLMHIHDPAAAVREMLRVTRKGGQVLAVEPNNMANAMVTISTRKDEPLDERFRLARFQATCELGKLRLGKGHSSIGDQLPGLFAAAGLHHIRVYLNDRATPLIPPYESRAERALVDQVLTWADKDIWIWDREETLRCYLAGGGPEPDFNSLWKQALKVTKEEAAAMRTNSLTTPGGHMTYLVSGVKP
jgi:SAM-dependent methyltransferase